MITLEEILMGRIKFEDMPADHQANCQELLEKINKVRTKLAKPMHVNSGYRSKADQIRIYKDLAAQRGKPFDEAKIPWGSAHLKCAAVDIADNEARDLYQWCQDNEDFLAEVGLWMETKDDQKRVHFQIYAPRSGNRFFNP